MGTTTLKYLLEMREWDLTKSVPDCGTVTALHILDDYVQFSSQHSGQGLGAIGTSRV